MPSAAAPTSPAVRLCGSGGTDDAPEPAVGAQMVIPRRRRQVPPAAPHCWSGTLRRWSRRGVVDGGSGCSRTGIGSSAARRPPVRFSAVPKPKPAPPFRGLWPSFLDRPPALLRRLGEASTVARARRACWLGRRDCQPESTSVASRAGLCARASLGPHRSGSPAFGRSGTCPAVPSTIVRVTPGRRNEGRCRGPRRRAVRRAALAEWGYPARALLSVRAARIRAATRDHTLTAVACETSGRVHAVR